MADAIVEIRTADAGVKRMPPGALEQQPLLDVGGVVKAQTFEELAAGDLLRSVQFDVAAEERVDVDRYGRRSLDRSDPPVSTI